MKNPRACSSEVVAGNLMASMVNLRRSLGRDLASNGDPGCLSLDIALSNCMSSVGTDEFVYEHGGG